MPISKHPKTQTIALIQGLQAALDAKASINHTHKIAIIEGLQTALNNKSAIDHTHMPSAWQDLSLTMLWSNYATGYRTPQVRKYPNGIIEVKGLVKKTIALVTNEVICTLPVGYRPSEIMLLATWATGGTSRIQVETNGAIKINSGNNGGVGLDFLFGL
jgi:hypothetical protein